MPLLAENQDHINSNAQYNVYAVDLRGFNQSYKPHGVHNYQLPLLVQDIIGIIRKISPARKVYLVGHDWGGGLAWEVARFAPNYVEKLFICNCPPVEVLFSSLMRIPQQIFQSYYIFMFQIPFLAEFMFQRYRLIQKMYSHITGPDHHNLTEKEIQYYIQAFQHPNGYAGINYYRAAMRGILTGKVPFQTPRIKCLTKVIWGVNDSALNVRLTKYLPIKVEPGKFKIKYINNATHNVQQNAPKPVAREILKHLP
jgi:epoxide hydrolase 4